MDLETVNNAVHFYRYENINEFCVKIFRRIKPLGMSTMHWGDANQYGEAFAVNGVPEHRELIKIKS
jgi:hypothetical protein